MPYADVADGMEPDAMTAAEISSFMLESIVEFHPKVSAILNITPDHLNRHHTMDNYIAAKERIAENQTKADTCVRTMTRNCCGHMEKTVRQMFCFSAVCINWNRA